jgi:AcrR family transcriptional regulator
MERAVAAVKRNYDASGRRARAEEIREELVETARGMLLADGYASLTIPNVAKACGVSVESVYKRFPGKPALVRAVVQRALEGIGPIAAETRSDALDAADLAALLRGWGRLTAEVAPRVAPILLLLEAAAGHDAELAALARELDHDRRSRMATNAARLADAGQLPTSLDIEAATDILLTYSSPQLYDLLVLRSGWDLQKYADFVSVGITAHLVA